MDKSRIAIIILVLIAIVFAVGIGVGISQDDEAEGNNITAGSDEGKIEGVMEKVPDFFSYLSRGKKLTPDDFVRQQGIGTTRTISFGPNTLVMAQIKPSDEDTRKALFKLVSGMRARIQYFPAAIPAEIEDQTTKDKLIKENWIDLEARASGKCDKRDESCKPLTIFKKGGRLEFTCASESPCRVELQQ